MKYLILMLVLISAITPLTAEMSGSGGAGIKFTTINGESQQLMGGKGGAIFKHDKWSWGLGGAQYSSTGDVENALNYGGFTISYNRVITPKISLNAGILLGGGSITLNTGSQDDVRIIEPEIGIQFKATDYMNIILSVNQRMVSGADSMADLDFNGSAIGISLLFGDD